MNMKAFNKNEKQQNVSRETFLNDENDRDYVVIGSSSPEALKAAVAVLRRFDPNAIVTNLPRDINFNSSENTMMGIVGSGSLKAHHIMIANLEHMQSMRDMGVLNLHETPLSAESVVLDIKIETLLLEKSDFVESKTIVEKPSVNPATRQSKYKKKYNKHRR